MDVTGKLLGIILIVFIGSLLRLRNRPTYTSSNKSDINPKEQKTDRERLQDWIPVYIENYFDRLESFGHTYRNHVNKSRSFLKNRLLNEPVKIATSFYGNESDILRMLQATMTNHTDGIIEYLLDTRNTSPYLIYETFPNSVTARGCRTTSKGVRNLPEFANFVIVIGKNSDSYDFFVKTAFPVKISP